MQMTISEHSGVLVVERCWCGVQHAVPQSLVDMQNRQHRDGIRQVGIYCPLGHAWIRSGDGEAARLKLELEKRTQAVMREKASHDQTRAALRETESRRRAEKGAKTKLKRRAANGVCPCCNRYFANVHKHMTSQHPDFAATAERDESAVV